MGEPRTSGAHGGVRLRPYAAPVAADPPPSEPGPAVAAGPATMVELGAALGADVTFQSATKYLGGHSDLTAGVLSVARRDALWDELGDLPFSTVEGR